MNPIKFIEPSSVSEAIMLLEQHGEDAKILAGGTSVVLMLQQRLIAPAVLISLGHVPDLGFIRLDDDGLHIGALTGIRTLERSPLVQQFSPALAHTFHVVANVRVRNQATIGGNLAAADYAADPPAMLTALDARVRAQGPDRLRDIPLTDFFLGFYTTALASDEILTEIIIPRPSTSARAAYHKYTSISAEGRPAVAVGAMAEFDDEQKCSQLRIAVGAAVETPQRVNEAESMVQGSVLSDELIAEIAERYAQTLDPLTDVRGSAWYRREMIRVFVRRALEEVRDGHR